MGDQVVEGYGAGADASERRLDANEIVEARRRQIANLRLRHGEPNPFCLQRCVAAAERAQQLDAPNLAPDEVVGVVHDTHAIGFSVANPNGRLV